jgi:SAM-dependent methyltransferase
MSGFTSGWLALRAAADRAARAETITAAAARWAQAHVGRTCRPLRIVDLGSGSGNNARFLAPRLGVPQDWTLIDDDETLLRHARMALADESLIVSIRCLPADLRSLREMRLDSVIAEADLVTASAFFDLVSKPWLSALTACAARPGSAVLATLTIDGRLQWTPADPYDGDVRKAVERHQRTDKGFGPALGGDACPELRGCLREHGARVLEASSDWRLGAAAAAMQRDLLAGWAAAANEVAPSEAATIEAWHARRSSALGNAHSAVLVGHRDFIAIW